MASHWFDPARVITPAESRAGQTRREHPNAYYLPPGMAEPPSVYKARIGFCRRRSARWVNCWALLTSPEWPDGCLIRELFRAKLHRGIRLEVVSGQRYTVTAPCDFGKLGIIDLPG